MEYEIDHNRRHNHLYLQYLENELLTIIYNNMTKSLTIRISEGIEEKFVHHVRTKNPLAVKRIIESLIYERTNVNFEFDNKKLIDLTNYEVTNGL